jgi:hypothetical protein
MKMKNHLWILVALCIAAAITTSQALAARTVESISEAIRAEEAVDVSLGKTGVFMPGSAYTGFVELIRYDAANTNPLRDLNFVQKLTDVRVTNGTGDEFERVIGFVYVYFNLNKAGRAAWDAGDLKIYHFDPKERGWVECSAPVLIRTKNAPNGRAACIISDFGLYGIAGER